MKTAISSPPFPFIVLLKVVFMISEELELSSIAAYSAEKDAEENKEVEKRLVVVCTRCTSIFLFIFSYIARASGPDLIYS